MQSEMSGKHPEQRSTNNDLPEQRRLNNDVVMNHEVRNHNFQEPRSPEQLLLGSTNRNK